MWGHFFFKKEGETTKLNSKQAKRKKNQNKIG